MYIVNNVDIRSLYEANFYIYYDDTTPHKYNYELCL